MQSTEFQENTSASIDIKELVYKYLSFLHWIILGAVLALAVAFFYLRYAPETYQASNVIKILDNNNSGFKMPTDALSFFSKGKVNLENETEVLQSSLLIERVVDELDLQNSYYSKGTIKETEIASKAPFFIQWNDVPEKVNEIEAMLEIEVTPKGYYLDQQKDLKIFGKPYVFKGNNFSIYLKDTSKTKKNPGTYQIVKTTKEHTIQAVKKSLAVSPVGKQSELLRLTVTANHPDKAAAIANTLANVFDADGVKDRQLVHKKTIDFVNERFGFLFKELDSIESNKANYKQGQQIADFQADAGALLATKSGTDVELNQAKTQAVLSGILIETLSKTKLNELLPANIGLEQVEVAALINQYNDLVLQQQKMLQSVGENHPNLVELRATQNELKNNLKASLATYKKVLQSKINSIGQISSGQSQQYAALPYQEKAIRSIERQQEIKEALYIILLQKREEAAVNLAIINPSIKMVDLAKASSMPISPKKAIIYLAALLLGLGIPIGILYVYFLLDTKIHSKKDVQAIVTEIPVLAEIPHIPGQDKLVKYLDRSVLSEAFRMLRTNLSFLIQDEHKPQVLFTTSTIKGEGKTFVSMNLAITLSTLNKKVILVGADLRNPQLHKMLKSTRHKKGVTNYLHDTTTALNDIIETGQEYNLKFDLIFSGTIPPNPAELLSNGRFEVLLEELKKEYDFVIVDTAPTLLVTDTTLIANLADLIVFVIRANHTDKKLLHFINELKALKKINNAGIVLNNVGEQKGYGYSYSYKYNYGYGYGYEADEVGSGRKRNWFAKELKRLKLLFKR
ncbi:GumC family protein [Flavobacterium sp. N2820]|uniref:GumC family protein n=1 Tax=Flavobacterium sp. N2820 TaxID=2986834 RepID=UPI002223F78B|nr:tyrosine-protein kinase family protein [Flavobacterium sp. N2820]